MITLSAQICISLSPWKCLWFFFFLFFFHHRFFFVLCATKWKNDFSFDFVVNSCALSRMFHEFVVLVLLCLNTPFARPTKWPLHCCQQVQLLLINFITQCELFTINAWMNNKKKEQHQNQQQDHCIICIHHVKIDDHLQNWIINHKNLIRFSLCCDLFIYSPTSFLMMIP